MKFPLNFADQTMEDEAIYDEWGYHHTLNVLVDFLLPTGIYIPMEVPRNATIKQVKQVQPSQNCFQLAVTIVS